MQVLCGVVSACEEQASFLVNVKSLFYSVRQPVRENERDTRRGRSVVKWRETGDEGLCPDRRPKKIIPRYETSFVSIFFSRIDKRYNRSISVLQHFPSRPVKITFSSLRATGRKNFARPRETKRANSSKQKILYSADSWISNN